MSSTRKTHTHTQRERDTRALKGSQCCCHFLSCRSPVREAHEGARHVAQHPAGTLHPPPLPDEQERHRDVGEHAGEAGEGVRHQDLGEVDVRRGKEDARQGREKQRRVFPAVVFGFSDRAESEQKGGRKEGRKVEVPIRVCLFGCYDARQVLCVS